MPRGRREREHHHPTAHTCKICHLSLSVLEKSSAQTSAIVCLQLQLELLMNKQNLPSLISRLQSETPTFFCSVNFASLNAKMPLSKGKAKKKACKPDPACNLNGSDVLLGETTENIQGQGENAKFVVIFRLTKKYTITLSAPLISYRNQILKPVVAQIVATQSRQLPQRER